MTEVIVTGGADDDDGDLADEAERDAFVAAGAAGAHEQTAEHHATAATDAALSASTAAQLSGEAAATAGDAATEATAAATEIGALIAAHTEAMREQTAAIAGLVAEFQQSRTPATPPPAEPVSNKPDREPKSGRKKFRDSYYGRR